MTTFLTITLLFLVTASGQQPLPWTYGEGRNGWCRVAKTCCSRYQSPVDLPPDAPRVRVTPLRFHGYDRIPRAMRLSNSGHTVNVAIEDDEVVASLSGGGLKTRYLFDSFHFHWGSVDTQGSEHTVGGQNFSLELHFVHYSSKYKSFDAAKQTTNDSEAIAVLAVLFNATEDNEVRGPLAPLARALSSVQFRDEEALVSPWGFPLEALVPHDVTSAFRYRGSLTTPPCTQAVVWTIFTEILPISQEALSSFRDVKSTTANDISHPQLEDNFRFVQELNGRKIVVIDASLPASTTAAMPCTTEKTTTNSGLY